MKSPETDKFCPWQINKMWDNSPIMATKIASKPQPFTSLKEICSAHSQLKQRRYQRGMVPSLLEDVSQFVQRGQITGIYLAQESDRLYVQAMLDYWTNILYRAEWPEPEATLAPFQPTSYPLAV